MSKSEHSCFDLAVFQFLTFRHRLYCLVFGGSDFRQLGPKLDCLLFNITLYSYNSKTECSVFRQCRNMDILVFQLAVFGFLIFRPRLYCSVFGGSDFRQLGPKAGLFIVQFYPLQL